MLPARIKCHSQTLRAYLHSKDPSTASVFPQLSSKAESAKIQSKPNPGNPNHGATPLLCSKYADAFMTHGTGGGGDFFLI